MYSARATRRGVFSSFIFCRVFGRRGRGRARAARLEQRLQRARERARPRGGRGGDGRERRRRRLARRARQRDDEEDARHDAREGETSPCTACRMGSRTYMSASPFPPTPHAEYALTRSLVALSGAPGQLQGEEEAEKVWSGARCQRRCGCVALADARGRLALRREERPRVRKGGGSTEGGKFHKGEGEGVIWRGQGAARRVVGGGRRLRGGQECWPRPRCARGARPARTHFVAQEEDAIQGAAA
eukprot:6187459-Pleurochrysis_carterae.AAC.2